MNQNQVNTYILKFISGKYQGGEFPLELNKEIFIGRGSEFDMVLVEDMVSRKHARITSHNGELFIEDLGSTNGTFVNGEKVSKTRINEGDRILIGTNIIKLIQRNESLDDSIVQQAFQANQAAPSPFSGDNKPSASSANATMTGAISGLLEEVPLIDLLRLFASSKKSGLLVLHTEKDTAQIYLRGGQVFYATLNDNYELAPQKAFYRIIPWKKGSFSLEHPREEHFQNELTESTEALIAEGMRQYEEIHKLGADVPKDDDVLIMNRPLVAPLRSLTPTLCDSLQLAHNYGHVSTILDKSLVSDLETMQDLVYLLRNDYMKVHA